MSDLPPRTNDPPHIEHPPHIERPPQGWLKALARLWLLRPARVSPSAASMRAGITMAALWLAIWVAIDRWQSQPEPKFFAGSIPLFSWYVLATLGLAALLRWRSHPAPAFAPALTLCIGAIPVPLLFAGMFAAELDPAWFLGGCIVVGIYSVIYLALGLHAITGRSQLAAACAGLLFIAAFGWLTDALDVIPDVWAPREAHTTTQPGGDSAVDGEAILFGQAARIDESLETMGRETSPEPKVFFLGFAGVGEEKEFAQEVGLASRVLGERYEIEGRSLSLINDERDLERAPLATVSGLAYALRGIGKRMNLEQDVLFLAISSHGAADPAIVVSNSQLPLKDLTDVDLADALGASGIKWRVVVVSACYAGGFIDSLKNPQTIVITAAAADRTSFGCSNDRDLTYFGEAFYRDALPTARSLHAAFDAAKAAIAAREQAEHITASNPQAFFGAKIEAKLASMNLRSLERRPPASIVALRGLSSRHRKL